ncbi:hypothetical protein D3C80_1981870 [compost metagenome]
MGGAAVAAEQPGTAEQEHASADRAEAPGTAHSVRQPALQPWQRDVIGTGAAWNQQQVDGVGKALKGQLGHDGQPA